MVPGRTVRLFTDKAEAVLKTTASFDGGQVECIDIHGVWVVRRARVRQAKVLVSVGWLGAISMMYEGDFLGNLFLETEVGSFFIPEGEGGGYHIHGLDAVHDPSGDSCGKIGNQGGGVFQFVILGMDNIQFECIDVFLELLSRIDSGGG